MFDQFLNKATDLLAKGEAFVTLSVVRSQAPSSGKPGDKAIVLADGKMWGWIGGGCVQPVVIKEALRALTDGQPRLVRVSPTAAAEEGIVDYTMTCHSGGTLDIYIEPVLPKPHIVILGRSPVARTLARLGKTIGYRVSAAASGADHEQFPDVDLLQADLNSDQLGVTRDTFIVVSTQGEDDEEALKQAVSTDANYVAFVASRVKAQKVGEYLREMGMSSERVSRVRAPAGLDLHATSPEEIAVSILAEIVQLKNDRARASPEPKKTVAPVSSLPVVNVPAANSPVSTLGSPNGEARDPVCGMPTSITGAKYRSEYRGTSVYFCCARCKQAFDRQPEKYSLLLSG
jgi:xanthine dehydrogenase accessory factor